MNQNQHFHLSSSLSLVTHECKYFWTKQAVIIMASLFFWYIFHGVAIVETFTLCLDKNLEGIGKDGKGKEREEILGKVSHVCLRIRESGGKELSFSLKTFLLPSYLVINKTKWLNSFKSFLSNPTITKLELVYKQRNLYPFKC